MPSVEALWTTDFDTVAGTVNTGIVILETGRIFGADGELYYLGRYELAGQQITATVEVTRYLLGPVVTAWGDNAPVFQVRLTGTILDPLPGTTNVRMSGQMHREGFPPLGVRMLKRAELP